MLEIFNMADEGGVGNPEFLLFLSNNEVFVWDKGAINTLRKDYRIVGSLVGSLPGNPRQNLFYSLPLVLLHEEAKLLLDKKLATLVVSTPPSPSQDAVDCFQEERKANIEEQIEHLKKIKQQKLEQFAGVIEEARDKKRESGCLKRGHLSENVDDTSKKQCLEDSAKLEDDDIIKDSLVNSKATQNPNSFQDIQPLETNCESQDSTLIYISCEQPLPLLKTTKVQWTFPSTEQESFRYKVFCDLWEKGYYITQGGKFGGDYLVYPGDPFRFHSYFVVSVIPWNKKLSPLELITIGRLGSSTKKTSVLASVNCRGKIIYTSLQWPGFT